MELRHLRYFLAVADAAHFRHAAESLHVSQPTLSLQVQQLEKELGVPLFDRIGRGVRLTAAGELFRNHARRVLRELEEAQAGLDELDGLKRGRLAVGVVQTVNAYLIPVVVAEFSAAYPGVTLLVEELSASGVEIGVSEGRLDLGVSFVPPADTGLDAELLFEEELVLVIPRRHPWSRRQTVRVSELGNEPLMVMPRGFYTRQMVDEAFRVAGISAKVVVEMNSVAAIVATVQRGGHATILPLLAIPDKVTHVRTVRLEGPTPSREVGLLMRKGGFPLRARDAFACVMRSAAQRRKCS
ncbi:transcriptional regulator CynR [Singulisphaera acidiphila]|uniref:Transcriptional regulator n=1 Tax=Singulisphaera acidiphila (strain ATCC BAA-1392 / DSM 18658 / VKM B-2454 / MOB10) TaxID=886293 RepID=L0DMB2_SINAD|nr:transcriptional regulator CynR [Singulisphaera acidiphila]AGA30377.1 transcriptional regulator [Singulisphaera acidiphila DSM 18658]